MQHTLSACALIAAASVASAHETWLMPSDFSAPAGASLEFSMSSGMGFPDLGSGIDPTRLNEAVLMVGEERRSLVPSASRESALVLSGIPEAGMVCAWVHLHPRILEIPEADSVEHYLEEIGAPESVWEAWRGERGEALWRESYSKLARTYLRSSDSSGGDSSGDGACLTATSAARFDILPLEDPNTLAPGDRLELQVLFDGEPLEGQALGLMHEGGEPAALVYTDAAGRVALEMPASGRHMVYATNLRPANGEDFNWESDFATLTFEVLK